MNAMKGVLATAGIILVGVVGWWVLKMLFGAAFYVILIVLMIGGGLYLYAKAQRRARR
jgi:hypothetical protein